MKRICMTAMTMALMCGTAMAADMNNNSMTNTNSNSDAAMTRSTMSRDNSAMTQAAPAAGNSAITAANVKALPAEGKMVRIMGTVKSVSSDEKFTLSDAKGKTVAVMTQSASEPKLMKGDKVTVEGTVEKSMGKKSINEATVTKGMEHSMNDRAMGMQMAMDDHAEHNSMYRESPNGTPMAPSMNSHEEAMDNDNIENDNRQGVKVFTRSMSKNDYDARNKTASKGQVNIQPEKH